MFESGACETSNSTEYWKNKSYVARQKAINGVTIAGLDFARCQALNSGSSRPKSASKTKGVGLGSAALVSPLTRSCEEFPFKGSDKSARTLRSPDAFSSIHCFDQIALCGSAKLRPVAERAGVLCPRFVTGAETEICGCRSSKIKPARAWTPGTSEFGRRQSRMSANFVPGCLPMGSSGTRKRSWSWNISAIQTFSSPRPTN